jgi:hypothetical protein
MQRCERRRAPPSAPPVACHSQRIVEPRPDAINKALMLGNKVAFGTVNAAPRHDDQAAETLARADPDWLARLITRRLPPEHWPAA